MQQLFFEPAWDRTIAPQDREEMIQFFHSTTPYIEDIVHFSFLREATNHESDILVTVLIHNRKNKALSIKNKVIRYMHHDQVVATSVFDVPCLIQANTSMPWTFIFSLHDQTNQPVDYTITTSS